MTEIKCRLKKGKNNSGGDGRTVAEMKTMAADETMATA